MAPPSKPWFRFYTEALSDRKLRRLKPEHRWLWVAVLGAARMSCKPGSLYVGDGDPMTVDDLADIAAMPVKDVRAGMTAFVEAGMVDVDEHDAWVVCRWTERQFESDVSTHRTRKHRSMERSIAVPETVTEQPMERPQKTETDTDTKTLPLEPVSAPPVEPLEPAVVEDDGFDEFWSKYPRRNGVRVGKQAAHKAWKRLPKSKRGDVLRALDAYASSCGEYPKDAERWLRPGVWDEWLTPAAAPIVEDRTVRVRNGVRERFIPGAGWCAETRPRELADWEA